MADNTLDVSTPLKFEIKSPPRGMTDYDPSAIDVTQQQQLNSYKINLMRENMAYLSRHPEVNAMYSWAAEYFWKVRPKDVLGRLAQMYTIPEFKFRREIKRIIIEETFRNEYELEESEGEDWDY